MEGVLLVLAKGGFRFKAVSGSDPEKRFGSDLMTDAWGVFIGSQASVSGFMVRPPITWAAVCCENSTPRLQKKQSRQKERTMRSRLRSNAFS